MGSPVKEGVLVLSWAGAVGLGWWCGLGNVGGVGRVGKGGSIRDPEGRVRLWWARPRTHWCR